MTKQMQERFEYNQKQFLLGPCSNYDNFFDVTKLGFTPVSTDTCNWSGYHAEFSVNNLDLVVKNLSVNLYRPKNNYLSYDRLGEPLEGPPVNNIRPILNGGNNYYKEINYKLDYTGNILILGGGAAKDGFFDMDECEPAWNNQIVLELVFKNGKLFQEHDKSSNAAIIRKKVRSFCKAHNKLLPDMNISSWLYNHLSKELKYFICNSFEAKYRCFRVD